MHLHAQAPNDRLLDSKSLLDHATRRLEKQHSIQSDITYIADLLNHKINGKGNYAELRVKRIPYLRLELKLPLNDKMGALAKICDGRYLWSYQKVADHEKLEQIDMDRVQEALEKKYGPKPNAAPSRMVSLPPTAALPSIGAGGLSDILRQLTGHFDFAPTATETKLDQMPVFQLEGTWNRKNLLRLLPDQRKRIEQSAAPDLSKLPPHVPARVVLSLGARDLFPYKIEYFRTGTDAANLSDAAGQGRGAPLMTVYFHNVRFGQPIDETHFDYLPGDLEPIDKTSEYIKRL